MALDDELVLLVRHESPLGYKAYNQDGTAFTLPTALTNAWASGYTRMPHFFYEGRSWQFRGFSGLWQPRLITTGQQRLAVSVESAILTDGYAVRNERVSTVLYDNAAPGYTSFTPRRIYLGEVETWDGASPQDPYPESGTHTANIRWHQHTTDYVWFQDVNEDALYRTQITQTNTTADSVFGWFLNNRVVHVTDDHYYFTAATSSTERTLYRHPARLTFDAVDRETINTHANTALLRVSDYYSFILERVGTEWQIRRVRNSDGDETQIVQGSHAQAIPSNALINKFSVYTPNGYEPPEEDDPEPEPDPEPADPDPDPETPSTDAEEELPEPPRPFVLIEDLRTRLAVGVHG